MSHSQFHLLKTRRFLPLFLTQFLGAFNDNVFKNALVILITYKAAAAEGMNAQILVTAAAGIFILPFFLFSAMAGQLADKYEKSRIIRMVKVAEIIFMIIATIGFHYSNIYLLFTVLFLMGMHSTFFGPLKYSILPYHLHEDEMIGGNALVETGTFLAILLGTILGGLLIVTDNGTTCVSAIILSIAALGWVTSRFIPHAPSTAHALHIKLNFFAETLNITRYASKNRPVFLAILGISWFWLVGAVFLSQFPAYSKNILGGNAQIVTLLLTVFSVGIGIGATLCNRLLKGEIHARYVPVAVLGMSIFIIDLYFASINITVPVSGELIGIVEFFTSFHHVHIILDMLFMSICGGVYIVPLYTIMQVRSDASHRSRIVAANNIMNALFMVVAALATMVMLELHFTVAEVFLLLALANGGVFFLVKRLVRG